MPFAKNTLTNPRVVPTASAPELASCATQVTSDGTPWWLPKPPPRSRSLAKGVVAGLSPAFGLLLLKLSKSPILGLICSGVTKLSTHVINQSTRFERRYKICFDRGISHREHEASRAAARGFSKPPHIKLRILHVGMIFFDPCCPKSTVPSF